MTKPADGLHASLSQILSSLPPPEQIPRSTGAFTHGSMRLRLYSPAGRDPQQPHDQDELYVVMRGTGSFVCNAGRHDFAPGDVLFTRAGAVHRFENFSADFLAWVVFYGPKGGERA